MKNDLERLIPESVPKLRELAASDPDANVRSLANDVLTIQNRR
jgi:hypothetical protein